MNRRLSSALNKGGSGDVVVADEPSTETSYANAYSVLATTSAQCDTDENVPPPPQAGRVASNGSRPSKSRTFNVLSNITQSLSRSSLVSLASSNRNPSSGSSSQHGALLADLAEKSARRPRSSLPRASAAGRSSGESDDMPRALRDNPRFVSEPQSSQYWSGRFAALHDRFQSELLSPKNLYALVSSYNSRSVVAASSSTSTAAKTASLIRPSATATAVLQTVGGERQSSWDVDTALLLDEDNRCRRIFLHLEAMCVTREARRSLYAFQQEYARRAGRECLLPRGRTMEDRGGFVSRLFSGGRRSMGGGSGNGPALAVKRLGAEQKSRRQLKGPSFM